MVAAHLSSSPKAQRATAIQRDSPTRCPQFRKENGMPCDVGCIPILYLNESSVGLDGFPPTRRITIDPTVTGWVKLWLTTEAGMEKVTNTWQAHWDVHKIPGKDKKIISAHIIRTNVPFSVQKRAFLNCLNLTGIKGRSLT